MGTGTVYPTLKKLQGYSHEKVTYTETLSTTVLVGKL
jgi:hypothetical protein